MPESDRWDRIESLFEAASALPAEAREAFLRDAARGPDGAPDEALVTEVMGLLRHSAEADAEWGTSAAAFAQPLLDAGDLRRGDQIGPYLIERELGRGGMGTVWLAHRTDDLRLRVALKVVRRGLDTDDVRRRFRQEHRVLGTLDHPGIARLLDGGVTPDGRPYFAMEYVRGEPIDAYCDRQRLPLAERLRLFEQVCEAVQYAHQRLVVHRDLKPSNILVEGGIGEDGGTRDAAQRSGGSETGERHPPPASRILHPSPSRVKLLDFGIAKVLDPDDLGLSRMLTRAEHRMLTPAFASPEQLRPDGEITTASDVYQLGLLLYTLLAGRPPVTVRRVLEPVEPVRPSEAVRETVTTTRADGTTETLTPEAISEARGLAPERLRRSLAGDLDTIVMMALRSEPERRYVSAAQLGEDVARHLAGQTVRARPPTLGYRASTFVRRHRAAVASGVGAALLLVAFAGAMAVQRTQTAQEARKARAVADVLGGLFAATNPMVADGDTLTVVEFLAASEDRVREDLADQPEVLGEVLTVIGNAYRDMTAFDRAAPALHEALAVRRRALGPRHPDVAETLGDLATMQFMADSLDAALASGREWLGLLRDLHGARAPETVPALARIAAVHLQAHRLDSARDVLDTGLAITRPRLASDPERHLSLVGLDGWYAAETGDHEASVRVAREILGLHRRTGAPEADVALTERILGSELYQSGQFDEARPVLERSLARYRRVFGPENRYTALVLGHLAETAAASGDAARADSLFAQALPLKSRYFGADSPEAGNTLLRYGRHARETGRLAQADTLLARAETVWTSQRGADSPERRLASAERALVRWDRGAHDAAADTLEALWARASGDPPSRNRASLQLWLSELRRRQRRMKDADRLRRDAAPWLRASPLHRAVEG